MSCPSRELLPGHVLGIATPAERESLTGHLGDCPDCAAELRTLKAALVALPLSVPPIAPPPALRERLLGNLESRFAGWEERVGTLFRADARLGAERLALVDRPGAWQAGPLPGIWLLHFPLPPTVPAGHAGFVRISPGVTFPAHRHLGEEYAVVLQGGYRDSSGTTGGRGDLIHNRAGTHHSFVALPGPDCIFAALVEVGIEFSGKPHEL